MVVAEAIAAATLLDARLLPLDATILEFPTRFTMQYA